jgi:hypothetical protein
MSGGTDASRESVDATNTRDPAPQARVQRHRPRGSPIAGDRAQHGCAHTGACCRRGSALAAAGDAERPRAGGDAVCRPRQFAANAPQGRAGLDARASRAAPSRRYPDAAVGGVPTGRTRGLRLQPLVRAVSRLGGPAVTDDAAGASRRRAPVRRLCRADCRTVRRAHRRGQSSAGLRRRDGRLQLHLRRGELDADAARLDRFACPRARLHGRRAGATGARQPQGRRDPRQLVRTRPQPISTWRPITAPRSFRHGRGAHATRPRSRSACWWSSAGYWRA